MGNTIACWRVIVSPAFGAVYVVQGIVLIVVRFTRQNCIVLHCRGFAGAVLAESWELPDKQQLPQ